MKTGKHADGIAGLIIKPKTGLRPAWGAVSDFEASLRANVDSADEIFAARLHRARTQPLSEIRVPMAGLLALADADEFGLNS